MFLVEEQFNLFRSFLGVLLLVEELFHSCSCLIQERFQPPFNIPDYKCVLDLERVLDNKNAFLILTFFSCKFYSVLSVLLLIVPIFIRTSSMHWFFFFGTMRLFLIVPFVLLKERSFPRNDSQPYLYVANSYVLCRRVEKKLSPLKKVIFMYIHCTF